LNEKYKWHGKFDETKVSAALPALLARFVPGFGPEAPGDALRLIRKLAVDPRLSDLRFMAYMLATAAKESKKIRLYTLPKFTRSGAAMIDARTGKPMTRDIKLWTVFNAIEEDGLGGNRDYRDPVKVVRTSSGALVTERDGDQFSVSSDGQYRKAEGTRAKAARGSTHGIQPSTTYSAAAGAEHAYYGRGLVQLTWWNSYATAGVELGLGLELLLNPDKMLDFDTSYEVMVIGMVYGKSFANGRKCGDYFTDTKTDYAGARAMVNKKDPDAGIVRAALAYEALLLDARVAPPK